MKYIIRLATEKDCMGLSKLKHTVWEETYRGIYSDEKIDNFDYEKNKNSFLNMVNNPDVELYVVYDNENLIGYMEYGIPYRPYKNYKQEIGLLYLLKKYQREGIGKRLFDIACNKIKENGYNEFFVCCNKYNTNAQEFYKKMGGIIDEIDNDTDDKSIPQVKFIYKIGSMKDWSNYQNKTYGDDVCNLLIEFLDNYNVDTAIDLGCGSGNETVYMIKKGIKVLAIDRQLNKDFILDRLTNNEKELVSFKESSFENIELPKTKLLTAFFSIPFCSPDYFDELWNKIYNSIEDNGYFVGQLFGDRDAWNEVDSINTFTIEKVKEYLNRYEIIKLEEIEYVRESDNKKWHYYNIIAKK